MLKNNGNPVCCKNFICLSNRDAVIGYIKTTVENERKSIFTAVVKDIPFVEHRGDMIYAKVGQWQVITSIIEPQERSRKSFFARLASNTPPLENAKSIRYPFRSIFSSTIFNPFGLPL